MNVHLLTVGDEILIGQIVDTNSAWMARELNFQGAEIVGIRATGDDPSAIRRALSSCLEVADVVLMTGGLGPTKDDLTKKTLADFFGVDMVFDQGTYERIVRIFERLGRPANESHRLQSYMPANAQLLVNKMGTAPGMWFEYEGKVIVSMPGVPFEMKYLMEHEVLPRLRQRFPASPIAHRTILTAGMGESTVSERIAGFEDSLPPEIKLAYLPALGQVRLRLTGRGPDEAYIHKLLDEKKAELVGLLSDIIYGYENELLEEVLGQLLRERGKTIGTAESCTGGYVAHRLTSVPGSSDYFQGSIVTYSNELKQHLLQVREETLALHGAVSAETVSEMVRGALEVLGVDLAVAISGIAGPGGGTPEKPVGMIWMAVGSRDYIQVQKVQAGKDRLKNIEYAATHALNFVRKFVLEQYPLQTGTPSFVKR